MPDPDAQLPDDPLQRPRTLAGEIERASIIIDGLVEARAASPERYAAALDALRLDDYRVCLELLLIRETGVVEGVERRRRRWRPWKWRFRRPPWR